jgi:hypothetical protein
MTTDTPRTDAEYCKWIHGPECSNALANFARHLERELNTAISDLYLRRELYKLLEKERDNLYEQIQNLRRDA